MGQEGFPSCATSSPGVCRYIYDKKSDPCQLANTIFPNGQEATFSLGSWSRVKRFLANSKIVKPTKEVERQMRQLTVLKAICVPLAIAAADIATDTGLLINMWSYILNPEVTDASGLIGVRMASIFILVLSVINMVTGNPAKTLIRNAHTAVLMESRKLEKRDIRPSVGESSH